MRPLWVIMPRGRRIPAVHNRTVLLDEDKSLDNEKDGKKGSAICVCLVSGTVRESVRAGQLGLATPRKVEGAAGVEPHSLVRSE